MYLWHLWIACEHAVQMPSSFYIVLFIRRIMAKNMHVFSTIAGFVGVFFTCLSFVSEVGLIFQ